MKNEIIIMMGIQGSGKGEMNTRLCGLRDFNMIETGEIFRTLDKGSECDAAVIKSMETGILVPDEMVCDLVISRLDCERDILTDGFPRTRPQAEKLIEWARANDFAIKAVFLNITRDLAIKRIGHRVTMGGGRKDDTNIDAINKRLDEFYAKTMPMVEFLRASPDVKFIDIDASDDIETVFGRILERI